MVAVHDLDAAGDFYQRLGFQVGERNRHPWGTENRLIQFNHSFIELITVGSEINAIPDHEPSRFSFGAFVCDYRHDGLAMLVLDSEDAKADAMLFAGQGIGSFEPFFFERKPARRACLDQLVRIFGPEASEAHATLLKDWAVDPLTATAADRGAGGHLMPGNAVWVSGPWQKRLALASRETSPSESGYLAGAVEAARRSAAEILLNRKINDHLG